MTQPTPWRRRERSSIGSPTLVTAGLLRKKRVSDNVVVQTIEVKNGTWPFQQKQVTWDQLHPGPPFKTGGPFASIQANADLGLRGVGVHKGSPISGGFYWEYTGGFARPFLSWETPTLASINTWGSVRDPFGAGGPITSAESWGSAAFDKLRPETQKADLSVFLYELKDVPRMLQTSAAFFKGRWQSLGGDLKSPTMRGAGLRSKKAADHFLNHQFGWVPFINDLLKINDTFSNQDAYIMEISKNNGTWIKKSRTLSKSITETITHSGFTQGIAWRPEFDSMSSDIQPGTYSRYRMEHTEIVSTKIWCAGETMFYRPEFDYSLSDYRSNWKQAMRLLHLYGAEINPYVLWRVTPWTWIIDWFLNIGGMIKALLNWNEDGYVARYAYVMKKSVKASRHVVTANWNSGPTTMTWLNSIESKQREVADNNFSFRLLGALSPMQLAIVAALGLTRMRPAK